MKPSWKPFITPSTAVRTITPIPTPSTDSSEEARPLERRRARKVRQAT